MAGGNACLFLCGRPGDTPARFAPKPIDLKPKDKLINIRFNLSWYTHALTCESSGREVKPQAEPGTRYLLVLRCNCIILC